MKRVTALRSLGPGRVLVELDEAEWRRVPVEAALRAGLAPGVPLDRERARALGRELRRLRALGAAVGALRHRDRSAAELTARMAAGGVAPAERERALETLERAGFVDDDRLARWRAAALAERGSGDALIRHDLEERGLSAELVDEALAALEPESVRAARIVARRGGGPGTVRYLAARGYGEDVVEATVASDRDEAIG